MILLAKANGNRSFYSQGEEKPLYNKGEPA